MKITFKLISMKAKNKSVKTVKNFDVLISKMSEKEILDIQEMSCVRGGDGESPIIIPPYPVKG